MPAREALRRIFVAVDLDPALRRAITALEEQLDAAGARGRWISPQNLHLTLRFLGEITSDELATVRECARSAAGTVRPFDLHLAGLGVFPSLHRPQVVWLGVTRGESELAALAARLSEALARHGFAPEERPFVAHLTLARVRDPRGSGHLVAALKAMRTASVGEQRVESLAVVESHLHPRGARLRERGGGSPGPSIEPFVEQGLDIVEFSPSQADLPGAPGENL